MRLTCAISALDFSATRPVFAVPNQWLIDYDGVTNSRFVMYLVAIWASIRVMLVAIAFATIIGVLVGVARLSSNWLLARMAMLFVEIFRNTPLLVQIVLWYAILIVAIPPIGEVFNIGNAYYLSNRGIAIPWPVPDPGWWNAANWLVWVWVALLAAAGGAAWWIRRGADCAGARHGPAALSQPLGVLALRRRRAGHLHRARRAGLDRQADHRGHTLPRRDDHHARVRRAGAGLSAYTASFIAEIVRAGIQALPAGQSEAANAIGLTGYHA